MTRRTAILLALLSLTILLSVAHLVDTARLTRLANSEATRRAEEMRSRYGSVEIATDVTVTREFIFLGAPQAKVTVYAYSPDQPPHEEPETHAPGPHAPHDSPLVGFEYSYSYAGGEWQTGDSSACSSEQCRVDGQKAFARSGIVLPQEISKPKSDHDDTDH
jgi:hypothetical protein